MTPVLLERHGSETYSIAKASSLTHQRRHFHLSHYDASGTSSAASSGGAVLLGNVQRAFAQFPPAVFGGLVKALVPNGVRREYWPFVAWKNIQRTVASTLSTLATQAVGVSSRHSLPAAAGLQWVLKDGLGKVGRLAFLAALGSSLDCHLKPIRFATSLLYTASLGLEMLTPVFPHRFLLLASAATVGKSISLAAAVATNPSVHRAFLLPQRDNLADISAKGQAQTVLADNVGLALAALCTMAFSGRHSKSHGCGFPSVPLLLFPWLAAADVFCLREELRSVPLRTLNAARLQLLAEHWLDTGVALPPEQVAQAEPLLPCLSRSRGRTPSIHVVPLHRHPLSLHQMHTILLQQRQAAGSKPSRLLKAPLNGQDSPAQLASPQLSPYLITAVSGCMEGQRGLVPWLRRRLQATGDSSEANLSLRHDGMPLLACSQFGLLTSGNGVLTAHSTVLRPESAGVPLRHLQHCCRPRQVFVSFSSTATDRNKIAALFEANVVAHHLSTRTARVGEKSATVDGSLFLSFEQSLQLQGWEMLMLSSEDMKWTYELLQARNNR